MEVRREERREAGRDRRILVTWARANPGNKVVKQLEEKQAVSWTRMAWSRLAWKVENRYWFSVVVDNTTRTLILLLNLPSQSSRYTPHTHFPRSACPLDSQVTWWLPTRWTSAKAIHLGFACCAFPTLLSAEQWKCCHSVASIMSIILEMCILKVVRSRLLRVPHPLWLGGGEQSVNWESESHQH